VLGVNFEREIREQPDVWRRIAASDRAHMLARAIRGRAVVLLGSGSSLFMAQLGALALRRRGIRALPRVRRRSTTLRTATPSWSRARKAANRPT
jgi:fructoselysine-6-P-deglycase FrlB-like protein